MWNVTVSDAEVLGVHAALLPSGHIIYFTGNEWDIAEQANKQFEHTRLYDCATDRVLFVSSPSKEDDVFCCGHAMLSSGRLLIAGGSENVIRTSAGTIETEPGIHHDLHVPGIRKAWTFDPFAQRWFSVADMAAGPLAEPSDSAPNPKPDQTGGRWYPTLVTLPTGKVLAFGGHPGSGDARHNNNAVELFDGASGLWFGDAPLNHNRDVDAAYYPRLHVLPTGDLFCSTLLNDDHNIADWWVYQTGQRTSPGRWVRSNTATEAINELDPIYRSANKNYRTTAVLLPLLPENGYAARILLCGGRTAWVITPGKTVNFSKTGTRSLGRDRRQCTGVLLPTGQVFVCGGVEGPFQESFAEIPDTDGVLEAELYSPESNSWQTLEPASVVRNYHSVALLMPDGRVWTAGSSINGAHSGKWRSEIEVYSPWYYGRPDRPEITNVSRSALSSDTLLIKTPRDDIQRVAILRTGSVTHCFNSDQRYIGLEFRRDSDGVLLAQIPSSDIAIPGYYLLFLIDHNGIPSKGEFINVTHSEFEEPEKSILFGLLEGILGVLPSGQVKRAPPGDPPFRDMLVGLAVYELAKNIEDAQERVAVQKASLNLVGNIAQKTSNRI
jgi:hypothetical protein